MRRVWCYKPKSKILEQTINNLEEGKILQSIDAVRFILQHWPICHPTLTITRLQQAHNHTNSSLGERGRTRLTFAEYTTHAGTLRTGSSWFVHCLNYPWGGHYRTTNKKPVVSMWTMRELRMQLGTFTITVLMGGFKPVLFLTVLSLPCSTKAWCYTHTYINTSSHSAKRFQQFSKSPAPCRVARASYSWISRIMATWQLFFWK